MKRLTVLSMILILTYKSLGLSLPETKETEKMVEDNILNNFLDVANDPDLYISQKITTFKKNNQNQYTPDGGIKTPVTRENIEIMPLTSIWDRNKYCMDGGECVTESYKRILLITIPTKFCTELACTEDKIIFTMKGGIKTACPTKDSTNCVDSTILYLPEEMVMAPANN